MGRRGRGREVVYRLDIVGWRNASLMSEIVAIPFIYFRYRNASRNIAFYRIESRTCYNSDLSDVAKSPSSISLSRRHGRLHRSIFYHYQLPYWHATASLIISLSPVSKVSNGEKQS